jgi:hypothetical protein
MIPTLKPELVGFLPTYFQHDPLGLFLVISGSAALLALLSIFILSKILP